ncbi:MAG: sigma-54-dependent Fis family transcriptional regulator [Deltaproteobacteria bacterium]|nr:sigma-54-dependent Fis family transcriptional regulator [Deltaproteobacteria bacterium]
MKPRVLVVDDDAGVRYTLREILESSDIDVAEAADGVEALSWLQGNRADLLITDLMMPNLDGMKLLERLKAIPQAPKVIMLTAHGSERHAVQAIKLGACDYFSKPFDADQVMRVVERAVAAVRMQEENEQLRAELLLSRHMVFTSDAMKRVALLVYRVAPRNVSVLITGPSGTGKERVADAIVAGSPRAAAPFVRFNCAAVPRELAEAELFGHARGAFTGAVKARIGLFREANGGTLLLDEVGEIDLATQGKLLRALQEGYIRPVGEDREVKVDVRVVAATNRDLKQEVSAGRFREDLFYRLNVVEIALPPLRDRADDIPPLIDHFLRKFTERFGTGSVTLSAPLRQALCVGSWQGNVRELEHRIERMVALSSGGVIDDETLTVQEESKEAGDGFGLKEKVEAFERGLILQALREYGGNRSETARRLGIGRVTLLDKMKKYGIE